jgi:hypothetical protein
MKETTHNPVPAPLDTLHAELRALIASSRQRLAGAVNAELTRLYWSVGQRLRTEVLGGADRAKYGDQLINRVGDQLAQEFGRGFEAKNLRRMVQFAVAFPDTEKVASLMRHLSWTHFLQLLPVKTDAARWFYAQQSVESRWSVRELHHQIERKAFERTELAALQTNTPVQAEPVVAANTAPALVFKDPYFLDFLGWKRAPGPRRGRLGSCHPAPTGSLHPGAGPGEKAPIGLILCAESSREQVELLQMHKDGITVAEYWTELPPKAELEQKLHAALLEARERLARRGVLLGDLDDE